MSDEAVPGAGFGQLLRRCRKICGLTQEELSERAGVSVRTIADLERGRRTRPYRQTIAALAGALGLRGRELDGFVRVARPSLRPISDDGPADPTPGAQGMPVPRQLPAAVAGFTGRSGELAALTSLLGPEAETQRPALVISAIGGTAGVGKTALAVHWAHRVKDLFPGGQLYVNLRGYDPYEPVGPGIALAGFLQALGVPGQQIPDETEDRARLYRSRLAGLRMLVVLDNARDAEQVRPLLPGDPGCVAVITSRDQLAGLVAVDGARRLDLGVLPLADAVELLRSLIGARADEDPEAATRLAGLCARLPLALRIAAELTASRPAAPLRELAAELAHSRLDHLDAGDNRADVRAVFSWSVRQLPEHLVGAFALLGLHPGDDLDAYAAAALTGTGPRQADLMLSLLHRASLIQAVEAGRYGMHDLLRAYAREQAAGRDAVGNRQRALTRLFDYYLAASVTATDLAFPAQAGRRRGPLKLADTAVPHLASATAALAWLDAERANLTAVVVHCAGHGWPQVAADLAGTLYHYLLDSGHLPEAQTIYRHALDAARQSADVINEGRALNGLGSICTVRGHGPEAVGYYLSALEAFRRADDWIRQAEVLTNLAITEHDLRIYPAAVHYFGQALAVYEERRDATGVARTLALLAATEIELGRFDDAAAYLYRALPVLADTSDLAYEGCALGLMGRLSLRRGQLPEAAGYLERAIALCRRIGYRPAQPTGFATSAR